MIDKRKKDIFNWNHISGNLSEDQISELKALYEFYHKKYWLFKMTHKYFKKAEHRICSFSCVRDSYRWCNIESHCSWNNIWYRFIIENIFRSQKLQKED